MNTIKITVLYRIKDHVEMANLHIRIHIAPTRLYGNREVKEMLGIQDKLLWKYRELSDMTKMKISQLLKGNTSHNCQFEG
ncbi:MAG: hypothetical protein NC453_04860 [Muribaculum sp.]|nr:hypothetical protein [Muribaculum sp.]